MNYINKIVMITGAANGIGRAISEMYAEAGAIVILVDKDKEAGERTAAFYREQGYQAYFFMRLICEGLLILPSCLLPFRVNMEKVDVLINNAGLSKFKPFFWT
ncbi:hypothetical protein GCM10020331_058390 [Ectobacillus funiculus]